MRIEFVTKGNNFGAHDIEHSYFGTSICDLIHAACYWNFMPDVEYSPDTIVAKFEHGIKELSKSRKDYSLWTDEDIAVALNIMLDAIDVTSLNTVVCGEGIKVVFRNVNVSPYYDGMHGYNEGE